MGVEVGHPLPVPVLLLFVVTGCVGHVKLPLVTDVELANGGITTGVVVAAGTVELPEAVAFAAAVVVVLGFGWNVVPGAFGGSHARHAHCSRCTTAGAADSSPWPSSTSPPKAAYPLVAFCWTCTPKLSLSVRLPRSAAGLVEQSDHTATLEKSSIAPIALAESDGRLLVRDTLRETGDDCVAAADVHDTPAATPKELPLLSAAYPRIDTVSSASCQPADACEKCAWIVHSVEVGKREVPPTFPCVASRFRPCKLMVQSDQPVVLHVVVAVPGRQPAPEKVMSSTCGSTGGSMEMPSCWAAFTLCTTAAARAATSERVNMVRENVVEMASDQRVLSMGTLFFLLFFQTGTYTHISQKDWHLGRNSNIFPWSPLCSEIRHLKKERDFTLNCLTSK